MASIAIFYRSPNILVVIPVAHMSLWRRSSQIRSDRTTLTIGMVVKGKKNLNPERSMRISRVAIVLTGPSSLSDLMMGAGSLDAR
jgi:hypothetical protein